MNKNILKVVESLGLDPLDVSQFLRCLADESAARPAIIWTRHRSSEAPFTVLQRDDNQLAGLPELISGDRCDFIDVLVDGQNPGAHYLHETGEIYCLDLSSVFAASVLSEAKWKDGRQAGLVVDTCSAPGGKAVYAWRSCQPQLLICNEVIGTRLSALISNIKRCRIAPAIVTNADPEHLATSLAELADLVLVDAPCSGQSLPAKGAKAIGAFHPSTINMNSNRQKRILANSAKMVAPGGYLAYMTCTFSIAENEGVIKWFLKRFPQFELQRIPHLVKFRSRIADMNCYRLLPHQGLGAGAFTCLMKRASEEQNPPESPNLDPTNSQKYRSQEVADFRSKDWSTFKSVWRNTP